jgi:membrane protease YdiL (CAAX protease family)
MASADDSDRASERPGPRLGRAALAELGIGAAWIVGVAFALRLVELLLGPANLGGAIFGALAVDIAVGRLGVRWDEDDLPATARKRGAIRVAAGALVTVVVGGVVVAVAAALHWFHREGPAAPSSALAFALVRAFAVATRDELLFRGVTLRVAARAGVRPGIARAFAALLGGAALVMVPGVTPAAVALAVALGWLTATLWTRDRGAWAAVGAHAAWLAIVGSAIHGGLLDLDWTNGELAIGASAAGPPAWLAAALLVGAAFVVPKLPWPAVAHVAPASTPPPQ